MCTQSAIGNSSKTSYGRIIKKGNTGNTVSGVMRVGWGVADSQHSSLLKLYTHPLEVCLYLRKKKVSAKSLTKQIGFQPKDCE